MARHRFGPLRVLEIEGRTALLWVGYDLGLDTLALDMMHADFDLVTGLLGRPGAGHMADAGCLGGRGSAADVVLGYPDAIARCASSSLMPRPYGARRLACHLYRRGARVRHARRVHRRGPGRPHRIHR